MTTRSRSSGRPPAGEGHPSEGPPSPAGPDPITIANELGISPEVVWYMTERGLPLPEPWQRPLIKTPEPRDVPGARFDAQRVDRVLKAFKLLRHTQGQCAGKPLNPDPWQSAHVLAPVLGWVQSDDDSQGYD